MITNQVTEEAKMTTVKKDKIDSRKFETKVIKVIKSIKQMDDFEQKETILTMLRELHNGCLEWSAPEEAFKIVEELR